MCGNNEPINSTDYSIDFATMVSAVINKVIKQIHNRTKRFPCPPNIKSKFFPRRLALLHRSGLIYKAKYFLSTSIRLSSDWYPTRRASDLFINTII